MVVTEMDRDSTDDKERYAFVYDEAMRSLDQQRETLDSVYSRTGTLLSAAAIATSFLGGVAFDDDNVGGAGIVAVALFAVLGGICAWILIPRRWNFHWGTSLLLKNYIEADEPASMPDTHKDLAIHAEENMGVNRKKIQWLMVGYIVATVLLVSEIVGWLIEL
jgi:predicted permease